MKSLKQLVTRNYYPLMYLLIAGSFLGFTAELVLTGHWNGIQLVGLAAGIIGLVLAVVALFAAPRMRQTLAVLFVILSLSGVMGTIQHNEARSGEEASAPVIVAATADFSRELPAEQRQEGEEKEAVPPLAPLSLAGMSIIAAVTLLADGRNRQKAA
ncbi:MAG: hypothetical protein KDD92_09055 [Caldilineaceae bacterium]|nr:hypothetical protein [Caldilineaceae bacterium]